MEYCNDGMLVGFYLHVQHYANTPLLQEIKYINLLSEKERDWYWQGNI
jgi:hypothetical protein